MSRIILALAGAAALGLAACGHDPSGSDSALLLTDPDEMSLYVGQSAPLVSQVMTRNGRVEAPAVAYWSQDLRVARVSATGVVEAIAPGSTLVMSGYQTLVDSVRVTVQRDTRAEMHLLDIVPAVVAGATGGGAITVPFVAVDGFGRTQCRPASLSLRLNPVLASVQNTSYGEVCSFTLVPQAEGQDYLVATADGVRDSVQVVVQNGAYRAAFTEDALGVAVVGVARPLGVRILTARGEPVPGRAVQFSASPGLLSQSTGLTDATGLATVLWTPPTTLSSTGSTAQLSFQTSFPTGVTASQYATVRIVGSAPTTLDWYRADGLYYVTYSQIVTRTVPVDSAAAPTIYAVGRDVYGNHTAVLPQLTYRVLTDSLKYTLTKTEATCGGNVPPTPSYYACYAGFGFSAKSKGMLRIFATVDGLPTDSVDLQFK